MVLLRRIAVIGLGGLLLSAMAAMAANDKPGRYTMSPADGGFVRLDTETGEMAFCKRGSAGGWACEAMPDTQMAMRRDMDRLRRENEDLRNSGSANRKNDPGTAPDESDPVPPGGGTSKVPIPTEQDVDRLFDYVEGMVSKLKERLKRLEEKKADQGTPL